MTRWNARLGGLLAVQIVLVAAAWWPRGGDERPLAPLLEVDAGAVTAVTVSEPPGEDGAVNAVTLEKRGEDWVIASAGGYPAQAEKASALIATVADIQVRAPIATTAASHAALSVAADDFDKKVELVAGGVTATIYVGSGSGKSANVRDAEADEAFLARGFSSWSIDARDRGYFDPIYQEADAAAFETFSLRGPDVDLQLERVDGAWTMDGLGEGESLDQSKVEALVKKAATVRIGGLAPNGEQAEERGVRVEWTLTEEGESVSGGLRIGEKVDGKYRVRAEGERFAVLVSEYGVKDLVEATRASVLPDPPEEEDEEAP